MADAWVWLLVLAVLLLPIGLPALAVSRENSTATTSRTSFLIWTFFLLVPDAIMASNDDILVSIACVLAFAAYSYPFQQALTRRAREVGYSKAVAYWSIVPIVGTSIIAILMFAPPGHAARR